MYDLNIFLPMFLYLECFVYIIISMYLHGTIRSLTSLRLIYERRGGRSLIVGLLKCVWDAIAAAASVLAREAGHTRRLLAKRLLVTWFWRGRGDTFVPTHVAMEKLSQRRRMVARSYLSFAISEVA